VETGQQVVNDKLDREYSLEVLITITSFSIWLGNVPPIVGIEVVLKFHLGSF